MTDPAAEYDSPWKEALERYFAPFLALCFPEAHRDIDWSRAPEFLDKELQQVVRDAELGRRFADKLVKVWLANGEETWLLIHVEVQAQVDPDLSQRTFVYNYRLFDRYRREVVSLAVLGDPQPEWRPTAFGYGRWGIRMGLAFAVCKLLDFESRWAELEESDNPFALIVMAHLRTLTTQGAPADRLAWKVRLVRGLYERGFVREDVLELFRCIDWMMTLPEALDEQFEVALEELEQERQMPYITSIERRALERGLQQGLEQGRELGLEQGRELGLEQGRELGLEQGVQESILEILADRFSTVPEAVAAQVRAVSDLEALRRLRKAALAAGSLDEFQRALDSQHAN